MKKNETGSLLIYTRKPDGAGYTAALANSIHMAYSEDGKHFVPLHDNYGMVFPKATISEQNQIQAKGVKNPYLFFDTDGTYKIFAERINADGTADEKSKGKVLMFRSTDLIHFEECGLVDPVKRKEEEQVESDLEGIHSGNQIPIDKELGRTLLAKWSRIRNTGIEVPKSITVQTKDEVEKVRAAALYSDGSRHFKQVLWDTGAIDFSRPGTYEVEGRVCQKNYPFPEALGYADPQVFFWRGRYYFIATNDNVGAVGLFVREAEDVEGLFRKDTKEYKILDLDEEQDFVQCFWAPELHEIGGEIYILFAVSGRDWSPQSHIMKLKTGGNICAVEDWGTPIRVRKKDGSILNHLGITLDMTCFEMDGSYYLVWSQRYEIGTSNDSGSMLCIATIDPKIPWMLTSDPMDPDAWTKSGVPLLHYQSIDGIYGPGHNTFFSDENGDCMIVYHAQEKMAGTPRCTAIHRVHFDKNNMPVLDLAKTRDLDENFAKVKMEVLVRP